jgi:uncharacterized lipoprotein YmbA
LLEKERWIAPLGDEIRSALTLSLTKKWDATVPPAQPADDPKTVAPNVQIRLDVQRFDSVPGSYALIAAVSTLKLAVPGSPVRSASCRVSIKVPVGEGYEALARGHQAALDAIAALIAGEAAQMRTGPVTCDAAPGS